MRHNQSVGCGCAACCHLREERSRNPAATIKSPEPARRAADGTLVEPADVDDMVGMFQRERAFIYMDV